jgi:hypothetical protein
MECKEDYGKESKYKVRLVVKEDQLVAGEADVCAPVINLYEGGRGTAIFSITTANGCKVMKKDSQKASVLRHWTPQCCPEQVSKGLCFMLSERVYSTSRWLACRWQMHISMDKET